MRTIFFTRLLAGVAVLSGFAMGCRRHQTRTKPFHFYVVVDSTNHDRIRRTRHCLQQFIGGLRRDDCLTLYKLDRDCLEVFSPNQPIPEGQEKIAPLLRDRLTPGKAHGTRPNLVWAKLAEDIRRDPQPSTVLFLTDGDQDDNTSAALNQTHRAIQEITNQPQVQLLAIIGATPEQCERNRKELVPLGKRARVLDEKTGGDDLLKIVESAIQEGGK